ncbi:MAG: hypothetical protein KKG00_02125, partial [Bacteroidetes bacterium]|nr:hypothetical protein [Bacteroidota bacterium]
DCASVGENTVTLTVTDKNGNQSTATATVTVKDDTRPVISAPDRNVDTDPERCTATVLVEALATDNCQVGTPIGVRSDNLPLDASFPIGNTTITWNVTDSHGNPAPTLVQTIRVKDVNPDADGDGTGDPCDPSDPNLLKSYVVIGFEEVRMKANVVGSGSVGIVQNGKKVKLEEATTITAQHSFVIAPELDSKQGSQVSLYYPGQVAPAILPAFRTAAADCKTKLNIPDNSNPVTLDQSCYEEIRVGKNTHVTFVGQSTVSIKYLRLDDRARVDFAQPTDLLIEKKLDAEQYVTISRNGHAVRIFAGDDVKIDDGGTVDALVYSQKDLRVKGKKGRTSMSGLFIARKVDSDENVHWNQATPKPSRHTARTAAPNEVQTNAVVVDLAEESAEEMTVVVGPNPTRDILSVDIKLPQPVEVLLEVRDLRGMLFQSRQLAPQGTSLNEKVSLADYPEGVYLLNVQTAMERRVIKVMRVQ